MKSEKFTRTKFTEKYLSRRNKRPAILHLNALETLQQSKQKEQVSIYAEKVRTGDFDVLCEKLGNATPRDWHIDWRFDVKWEKQYFGNYSHYQKNKKQPWDVKFPWELSRLGHLIPIFQSFVIEGKEDAYQIVLNELTDWQQSNPFAYSVNWNPMEVSMRVINLTMLLEMLLITDIPAEKKQDLTGTLCKIIFLHGFFLYRNIEYTDVRGNHYTANLAGLAAAGTALKDFVPEAGKWLKYALNNWQKEVSLQILPDGVNFEKSVPYHRLVTELFLLLLRISESENKTVAETTKERLRNSCFYTKAYRSATGLCPMIGDNDDARVFYFDDYSIRDHAVVLQLSDALLGTSLTDRAEDKEKYAVSVWLTGTNPSFSTAASTEKINNYFSDGGMVISKSKTHRFITDIGEVGMLGRGGHGHNDLLSFVLDIDNRPFCIDSGSYMYTGDLETKDLLRSTAYHNTIQVGDAEMADFYGAYRIKDDARPEIKTVNFTTDKLITECSHEGFKSLNVPLKVTRRIELNTQSGNLKGFDSVKCEEKQVVKIHFHLHPDVEIKKVDTHRLILKNQETSVEFISENDKTELKIISVKYSIGYGHLADTKAVQLSYTATGNNVISWQFSNINTI